MKRRTWPLKGVVVTRCDRCACLLDEALDVFVTDEAGVWCVENEK